MNVFQSVLSGVCLILLFVWIAMLLNSIQYLF